MKYKKEKEYEDDNHMEDNIIKSCEELNITANEVQEVNVGSKLQSIRKSRGLSIRGLSELSGLAVNTLSLIENGKTSPSVSTLQQVARALDVQISQFFEVDVEERNIIHTQCGTRARNILEGMTIEDMGASYFGENVQPLVMTLEPGSGCGNGPIVHTGQEFIYCVSGQVTYKVDYVEYHLKSGDSLLFEAHLPHCWKNESKEICRLLLILMPADHKERVGKSHYKNA